MKKLILIAAILFVSVVTSACVNNFAVQELNDKAKIYTERGEYDEAIARLKSALDLDNGSFETLYNLGSVYSKTGDWESAIESFTQAALLKPDFADAYYSLAVSEENYANSLLENYSEEDIPAAERKLIYDLLQKAIQDYRDYLAKSPDAPDRKDVEQSIRSLEDLSHSNIIDESMARRI